MGRPVREGEDESIVRCILYSSKVVFFKRRLPLSAGSVKLGLYFDAASGDFSCFPFFLFRVLVSKQFFLPKLEQFRATTVRCFENSIPTPVFFFGVVAGCGRIASKK